MDNSIRVRNLRKTFGRREVFDDLSLDIENGKITAIFGPNGCGKSTLLNILAGIIKEDDGEYSIQNFNYFQFSYVFQNYRDSLLPWKKGFDNIAFPLEVQKEERKIIEQRVHDMQKFFGFDFDLKKYPYELSGGQQQILSFLQAIIVEPMVLFVDEPFSALDYEHNLYLREKLLEYYMKYKPTIVLITHTIEEAVHLADKIIVLSHAPARVAKVINNPLPYPRIIDVLQSKEFQRVRNKVLKAFLAEVRS